MKKLPLMQKLPLVKKTLSVLFILLIVATIFLGYDRRALSVMTMTLSNWIKSPGSLPRSYGLTVDLPYKNQGFFPVMVTFNDDADLSARLGREVRFIVDYTFADFNTSRQYSDIYLPESSLYGSYIGVYYLMGVGDDMTPHLAWSIAEFDAIYLALPAIGLEPVDVTFEPIGSQDAESARYSGFDWIILRSDLLVNGHNHNYQSFKLGYLQFGQPPKTTEDYPVVQMVGALHYTYLEDIDLYVILFATAKDHEMLKRLEQEILMRVEIAR